MGLHRFLCPEQESIHPSTYYMYLNYWPLNPDDPVTLTLTRVGLHVGYLALQLGPERDLDPELVLGAVVHQNEVRVVRVKETFLLVLLFRYLVAGWPLALKLEQLMFNHSYIHTFIHSYILSFIHSFIRYLVAGWPLALKLEQLMFNHSYIHTFIHSFLPSFLPPYIHSLSCSWPATCPEIRIINFQSFIHSYVHSFIHSFVIL